MQETQEPLNIKYVSESRLTMTENILPLCEIGKIEEWGEHLTGWTFGIYADKELIGKAHTLPAARAAAHRYAKLHHVATVVKDMANGASYSRFDSAGRRS